MMKLILAGSLALYAFVPTIVVATVFAVDDPWGCRSCLGTLSPIAFAVAIGALTVLGIKDMRK